MAKTSRSLERVRDALERHGIRAEIETFPSSTRTAADAASVVGCEVAQIAKSLVFRGRESGEPVLVVASGANRVDLEKIGDSVGEPLEMADANFVRERTGYAVGGVPPLGHDVPMRSFLDRDLLSFDRIWAAAGRPDSVFAVSPQELLDVTACEVIDVKSA